MLKKLIFIGLLQIVTLFGTDVYAARAPRPMPVAGPSPVTNPPVTVSGGIAGVCRSGSASAC